MLCSGRINNLLIISAKCLHSMMNYSELNCMLYRKILALFRASINLNLDSLWLSNLVKENVLLHLAECIKIRATSILNWVGSDFLNITFKGSPCWKILRICFIPERRQLKDESIIGRRYSFGYNFRFVLIKLFIFAIFPIVKRVCLASYGKSECSRH
jgi:hypothetical protein